MSFKLRDLPFDKSALAPHMSQQTLEFHYGKHHKAYVDKTNAAIEGGEYADAALEDIIRGASGGLFNNAAQVWNHSFFWNCLTPGGSEPDSALKGELEKAFGSLDAFKDKFASASAAQFGSGWGWLVRTADGGLDVVTTANAGNPMTDGQVPLLTCDVWEHAYYLDYQNRRPDFLNAFWEIVNWKFVADNLARDGVWDEAA